MSNSFEEIVEKIKKLLSLSNSSNVNEAALAQAKAAELMLKYQIDQSSINLEDKNHVEEPIEFFMFDEIDGKNRVFWKGSLASAIADFFSCKILYSGNDIKLIARKSDLNATLYLYKAICNQIEELTNDFCAIEGSKTGVHGKTWKSSFRMGCVSTVSQKFREQKQTLRQEYKTKGNELIVLDNLERNVNRYLSTIRTTKLNTKSSINSSSAYYSGSAAGKSVNIGNNNPGLNRPNSGLNNQPFRLPNKG